MRARESLTGLRFGDYILRSRLGRGAFSDVYAGVSDTAKSFAVKVEPTSKKVQRLPLEARAYEKLRDAHGIPHMHWSGEAHGHHAIVLDRRGPSLQEVLRETGGALPLDAVRRVGLQVLERMRTMHERSLLHCESKWFRNGISNRISGSIHIQL